MVFEDTEGLEASMPKSDYGNVLVLGILIRGRRHLYGRQEYMKEHEAIAIR